MDETIAVDSPDDKATSQQKPKVVSPERIATFLQAASPVSRFCHLWSAQTS
jgi:hypothetical protein